MKNFWDALASSIILSGTIALACIGTMCYLAIVGRPIPDVVTNICLVVVAFFFGNKVGQAEISARLRNTLPCEEPPVT